MSAFNNYPGGKPVSPPQLAVIEFPEGRYYVSRACEYQGFLVQRCYVGTDGCPQRVEGPARSGHLAGYCLEKFDFFTPRYIPTLHPAAIAAAGFDYQEVADWVTEHGEAVFAHPTYATFCLRWGENAHGYVVSLARKQALTGHGPPVYFTAHTIWPSRETVFVLESPLSEDSSLKGELVGHHALQYLEALVPNWRRGFGTWNLAEAQRVVTSQGYEWAWNQRESVYAVTVEVPGAARSARTEWRFATAEQARVWYDQLPAEQARETAPSPKSAYAMLRNWQQLAGEAFEEKEVTRKYLLSGWKNIPCYLTDDRVAAVAATGIAREELTELERPLDIQAVTLASLLDGQGLPLNVLSRRLQMDPEKIRRRKRHPTGWSIAELQRVAHLTQQPLSYVLTLLQQELLYAQ